MQLDEVVQTGRCAREAGPNTQKDEPVLGVKGAAEIRP
jgi:hypothetical protein